MASVRGHSVFNVPRTKGDESGYGGVLDFTQCSRGTRVGIISVCFRKSSVTLRHLLVAQNINADRTFRDAAGCRKAPSHCLDVAPQRAQIHVGALFDLRNSALVDASYCAMLVWVRLRARTELLQRQLSEQFLAPGFDLCPVLRAHLFGQVTELTSHHRILPLSRLAALFRGLP